MFNFSALPPPRPTPVFKILAATLIREVSEAWKTKDIVVEKSLSIDSGTT